MSIMYKCKTGFTADAGKQYKSGDYITNQQFYNDLFADERDNFEEVDDSIAIDAILNDIPDIE